MVAEKFLAGAIGTARRCRWCDIVHGGHDTQIQARSESRRTARALRLAIPWWQDFQRRSVQRTARGAAGQLRTQRPAGVRRVPGRLRGATELSTDVEICTPLQDRVLQHLQSPELWRPRQRSVQPAVRPLDTDAGKKPRPGRSQRRLQSAVSSGRTTLDSIGPQTGILTAPDRSVVRVMPLRSPQTNESRGVRSDLSHVGLEPTSVSEPGAIPRSNGPLSVTWHMLFQSHDPDGEVKTDAVLQQFWVFPRGPRHHDRDT